MVAFGKVGFTKWRTMEFSGPESWC